MKALVTGPSLLSGPTVCRDAAHPGLEARWLSARLIPHRHRPRAELQPAHEFQIDMIRETREQRRPMARQPGVHDELVLIDQSQLRQRKREPHASREQSLPWLPPLARGRWSVRQDARDDGVPCSGLPCEGGTGSVSDPLRRRWVTTLGQWQEGHIAAPPGAALGTPFRKNVSTTSPPGSRY